MTNKDDWTSRLQARGWKKLVELDGWTVAQNLQLYHPAWGFMTGVHPADRFGLDPEEVWGYIPPR